MPPRQPLLSSLLLLLAFGPAQAQRDATEDRERLQGSWVIIGLVDNGKNVPEEKLRADGIRVVFEADRLSYTEGDVRREFRFELDPAARPKAIDLTILSGERKGKTSAGIYRMEGDTLRLCVPESPDEPRPTEFASKEGSELVLFTLRRDKP